MTRDAFYARVPRARCVVLGAAAPPPPAFVDRVIVPGAKVARASDYSRSCASSRSARRPRRSRSSGSTSRVPRARARLGGRDGGRPAVAAAIAAGPDRTRLTYYRRDAPRARRCCHRHARPARPCRRRGDSVHAARLPARGPGAAGRQRRRLAARPRGRYPARGEEQPAGRARARERVARRPRHRVGVRAVRAAAPGRLRPQLRDDAADDAAGGRGRQLYSQVNDTWSLGASERFQTGTSVQINASEARSSSTLGTAPEPLNYYSQLSVGVSQPS